MISENSVVQDGVLSPVELLLRDARTAGLNSNWGLALKLWSDLKANGLRTSEVTTNVGLCLFKLGRREEASAVIHSVLDAKPDDAFANSIMAHIYEADGNMAKAFDIWDRLIYMVGLPEWLRMTAMKGRHRCGDQYLRKVIYEDDEIRVIQQLGNSDYLLITFGDMVSLAKDDRFYADTPATKMGLNCVGFMAKRPNWFPAPNMKSAAASISPIMAPFPSRVNYGGSMGGYAALKYSALLKVSDVIAFCPQWSIDPGECAGNKNGYENCFEPPMANMGIQPEDLSGRASILYDPSYRIDAFHYDKIGALSKAIVPVHVHSSEHSVTSLLAGSSILSEIIGACRTGNQKRLYEVINPVRRKSPTRKRILMTRAVIRHPRFALPILDALVARGTQGFEKPNDYYLALIKSSISRHQYEIARRALGRLETSICRFRLAMIRELIEGSGNDIGRGSFDDGVVTHHRTILAYSVFDRSLRHEPMSMLRHGAKGLRPVFLEQLGDTAILAIRIGEERVACFADGIERVDLTSLGGRDQSVCFVQAAGHGPSFTLKVGNDYACAEPGGTIIWNRKLAQAWEMFNIAEAPSGSVPVRRPRSTTQPAIN